VRRSSCRKYGELSGHDATSVARRARLSDAKSAPGGSSPASLISSLLHSRVNLAWCDKIKLCCHGRVALSKAYNYYQLRKLSWPWNNLAGTVRHLRQEGQSDTKSAPGGESLRHVVSLSVRLKDLLGPVTRVKKRKRHPTDFSQVDMRRDCGPNPLNLERERAQVHQIGLPK